MASNSLLPRLLPLLVCIAALSAGAAELVSTNSAPTQIVTCREDVDVDALLNEFHLSPTFIYRSLNGFAAPMDAATIQTLKSDGRVLFVEADGPVTLCEQTNSTGLVRMGIDQFPVARINGIPEPLDGDVAVIDSGIDPHPDLNVVRFFSPISANGNDEVGHGTGVAGIIGAMDNEFGVVGVAPGVRLWNIKVFSPTQNSWTSVITGMDYALQNSNQISVANMSIGNPGVNAPIASLRNALRRIVSAGIVVVASAGNNTNDLAGADGIYGTGDDAVPAACTPSPM